MLKLPNGDGLVNQILAGDSGSFRSGIGAIATFQLMALVRNFSSSDS